MAGQRGDPAGGELTRTAAPERRPAGGKVISEVVQDAGEFVEALQGPYASTRTIQVV